MNNETFSFDLVDTKTPETVIKEALVQIGEATRGYVQGVIKPYAGQIFSYTEKTGLSFTAFNFGEKEVKVDIQNQLGEIAKDNHRFEVFLRVKGLEHYKYRMMFVDYGAISYPVTIVMNESLATECYGKKGYIFTIHSMESLEEILNKVINSPIVYSLIQSLINEAMRQEANKQWLNDTEK